MSVAELRIALPESVMTATDAELTADVHQACARMAPAWPLSRWIAVNPWWGYREQAMPEALAEIEQLSGAITLLPAFGTGEHASLVAGVAPLTASAPPTLPTLAGFIDTRRHADHLPALTEVVCQAISQYCAAHFDRGQARWQPTTDGGLFAGWRRVAARDPEAETQSGLPGLTARMAALPADRQSLLQQACAALGVAPAWRRRYLTALLWSQSGWASWCAWLGWSAQGEAQDPKALADLLAIRLAWEWVLADLAASPAVLQAWRERWATTAPAQPDASRWSAQRALERDWQQQIQQRLRHARAARRTPGRNAASAAVPSRPRLQVVCCIDVRSEPLRRALEAQDPGIVTHGMAGFFGVPLAFDAGEDEAQPRVPGLVPASLPVGLDRNDERAPKAAGWRRELARRAAALRTSASGGFAWVDSVGWLYGVKLLRDTLSRSTSDTPRLADRLGRHGRLHLPEFDVDLAAELAGNALSQLVMPAGGWAPLVVLAGHGSQTRNNPHAAGLECGACGGHPGDVNAAVLAAWLNHADIRQRLSQRGLDLPDDTRFVGALHDTVTDEVALLPATDPTVALRLAELPPLSQWLEQAAAQTRQERAERAADWQGDDALAALAVTEGRRGIGAEARAGTVAGRRTADTGARARQRRARHWAELRPEWGLANNAGFFVAPRARTRGVNLEGRCFLHDYDPATDLDGSRLAGILAAPVVVAHWINLQYYAATVDNAKWGSGNKVLHNVVGRDIGVFEGNGGDLRTGLALQSVHDGQRWIHTPQRLTVWVEAPRERIEHVLAQQPVVRELVAGQWLHLLAIEPDGSDVWQWHPADQAWRTSITNRVPPPSA